MRESFLISDLKESENPDVLCQIPVTLYCGRVAEIPSTSEPMYPLQGFLEGLLKEMSLWSFRQEKAQMVHAYLGSFTISCGILSVGPSRRPWPFLPLTHGLQPNPKIQTRNAGRFRSSFEIPVLG